MDFSEINKIDEIKNINNFYKNNHIYTDIYTNASYICCINNDRVSMELINGKVSFDIIDTEDIDNGLIYIGPKEKYVEYLI